MTARPRKPPSPAKPSRDGDEDLVFHELNTLLVGRVQVGAAVEQPGTQSELVSFCVRAEAAGREAQLLVRILPEEGSYACWTLRKRDDPRYSSFLNTFDAFKA